jgi:hypothetical protein
MPKYIITYVRTMVAECEYDTMEEAVKHADAVVRQFAPGEVQKLSIYVDGYAPVADEARDTRRGERIARYEMERKKKPAP